MEASGFKAPLSAADVISLYSSETASHQLYSICVFLFIVFVVMHLGRECYKLFKQRSRYLKSLWSWAEICQFLLFVLAVAMHAIRMSIVTSTVKKLQENIYGNVRFHKAIIWQGAENAVLGILVFIITAKLLRIIWFNDHVAAFLKTCKICARSLSSFSVVFLIIFVAFLHFGVLVFDSESARYSSVLKATYFQLELAFGRVEARPIQELEESNSTFGRIFSSLLLVSLNEFIIAMINDALLEAKNTANQSELYDLVDESHRQSSKERKALVFDID